MDLSLLPHGRSHRKNLKLLKSGHELPEIRIELKNQGWSVSEVKHIIREADHLFLKSLNSPKKTFTISGRPEIYMAIGMMAIYGALVYYYIIDLGEYFWHVNGAFFTILGRIVVKSSVKRNRRGRFDR